MEFGRIEDPGKVDLHLPEDHPGNQKILSGKKHSAKPSVYTGCAKWSRKEWVGKLYPKGTKPADFLYWYGKSFNSVELNATFHQIPSSDQVKKWTNSVDDSFRFSPKFHASISHAKEPDPATLRRFLHCMNSFGKHLGPCFIQMPPHFTPSKIRELKNHLSVVADLPVPVFFEFRHPDWFNASSEAQDAIELLENEKAGLVITDTAGRRDCVHQRLTIPHAFIRFTGNHLHPTDFTRISDWAVRLKTWFERGLESLCFYIHNDSEEAEIHSPALGAYAVKELSENFLSSFLIHSYLSITIPYSESCDMLTSTTHFQRP